ncbi:hypothetical protein, partial [Peribacillus kribbensis]|uniref:hypothetical protein n=1 Tax=Peribacillus kribbensis TaxID=356658 RepID=UPI00054ED801
MEDTIGKAQNGAFPQRLISGRMNNRLIEKTILFEKQTPERHKMSRLWEALFFPWTDRLMTEGV